MQPSTSKMMSETKNNERKTQGMTPHRANRKLHSRRSCGSFVLSSLLLAAAMMFSGCGGSSSSADLPSAALSGNWQFTMTPPDPNYPATAQYGLQGGFLLQKDGAVTGQTVYSFASDVLQNGVPVACDSGSATITGTISGQNVTLTAVTGTQTFSLTGMLGPNGTSIVNGQFTTPGGTVGSGAVCGAATAQGTQAGWSAVLVPALSGSITGSFHSASTLDNEIFQVTGSLSQGSNIGATSATVTGALSFIDPVTQISDYPCFPAGGVNVTGQISGNTVILQLIGADGSSDGQIGIAPSQVPNSANIQQVTFDSTAPSGAYILHSAGVGYQVSTKTCKPPSGSTLGEFGYICLALNSATACQQPITLSPAALVFPPQLIACTEQNCPPNGLGAASTQTISLTNNQPAGSAPLTNLTLNFAPMINQSDFTNIPNMTESDNCAAFLSSSTSGQSCIITISFAPQESCSWIPNSAGTTVAGCPLSLTGTLTIGTPISADNDTSFAVLVTGSGLSYIQPSTSEVDFGAEAIGQASLPQLLTFTNQSAYPVQILGPRSTVCPFSNAPFILPSPLINDGAVAGLQVVTSSSYAAGVQPTIRYNCDADQTTGLPNFQLSMDTCTGANLAPHSSCSVEIALIPQPIYTQFAGGLDYFVELNTVQCAAQVGGAASDCEIDGGRFPVELKANGFSPLRMTPGAGLDFGLVTSGKKSVPQTVTLFNDPADPNSAAVNFSAKVAVTGSYSETDDCPSVLPVGGSCTLTVTFKPSAVGFSPGNLSIVYTLGSSTTQPAPQFVYLRGTGQ